MSHDRAFLDNVVTSTLAFEGEGRIGEYAGGYADWIRQRPQPARTAAAAPRAASVTVPRAERKRRLTYKEQQELASLPDVIDARERDRSLVYAQLADPLFLRDGAAVTAATVRLEALEAELAALAERWEILETIAVSA